jgi:hypothetical protein
MPAPAIEHVLHDHSLMSDAEYEAIKAKIIASL